MKHAPKHGRSGSAKGKFPENPHQIGRSGDKFCPGDSSSKQRYSQETWAADLSKPLKKTIRK